MIQAIETRYKGYRFRSRLEARWAVFFDALGVEWQYEPEGYVLSNGARYLPDFFVPGWNTFIEIKGTAPTEAERLKCALLRDGTQRAVLLCEGLPTEDDPFVSRASWWGWDIGDSSGGNSAEWHAFIGGAKDGFPVARIFINTDGDRRFYSHPSMDDWYAVAQDAEFFADRRYWDVSAHEAARGARFEHGESGAAPTWPR